MACCMAFPPAILGYQTGLAVSLMPPKTNRSSWTSIWRQAEGKIEEHDTSIEDEMGNYTLNREQPQTNCRSISMVHFFPDDKNQNFTIWASQFEDAVKNSTNSHS